NEPECNIVIFYDFDERLVLVHAHTGVLPRVAECDLQRPIRAAVVDDDVLDVPESLAEDALDTFGEKRLSVVNGGYNAHQRLRTPTAASPPTSRSFPSLPPHRWITPFGRLDLRTPDRHIRSTPARRVGRPTNIGFSSRDAWPGMAPVPSIRSASHRSKS